MALLTSRSANDAANDGDLSLEEDDRLSTGLHRTSSLRTATEQEWRLQKSTNIPHRAVSFKEKRTDYALISNSTRKTSLPIPRQKFVSLIRRNKR